MIVIGSKPRNHTLDTISKYSKDIKVYGGMLEVFEKEGFKSPYMKKLLGLLVNRKGSTSYLQIKKLDKINESVANRSYILYILFDIIFLLDYQFMFSLERWREESGKHLKVWFDTIGEVEALSSLSLIRYDNPDWCFPSIEDTACTFLAESMGHPLLGNSCVVNNLRFPLPSKILLITGSNMSGKSTFLRTAGVNLVLAYAGAPVYAKKFSCSIMDIYTSMRIKDDLEKNISSFYAELLRIKSVVEAVHKGRPIFFLLDEIFKGTNSIDRHTGGKILINKLSAEKVLGLVSTHDLELGELEEENSKVKNYHFQEHYKNNEIFFDYRLYPGVSTTRNAIFLMKMAGIDFD